MVKLILIILALMSVTAAAIVLPIAISNSAIDNKVPDVDSTCYRGEGEWHGEGSSGGDSSPVIPEPAMVAMVAIGVAMVVRGRARK